MPSTSLLDRITKVLGFHIFEQPWWDDVISKSHDEENWSGAKPTNQLLKLFLRKIHQVNLFMKHLAEISEFMKPALHTTRCAFSSNWSGVQTPESILGHLQRLFYHVTSPFITLVTGLLLYVSWVNIHLSVQISVSWKLAKFFRPLWKV